MDNYFPKTVLARKIETLILEESTEALVSTVRHQAMSCTVALSQVNPPLPLSQRLDLANAAISSIIPLPLITPSLDRKDGAGLYIQTVQALDDLLQALVMEGPQPSMAVLQSFLQIILPWLVQSEKVHEQARALGALSRLLRFICRFPELTHVAAFSMSGQLMGALGLVCMSPAQELSTGAAEALHYLFRVLVRHRSTKHKTEKILRDLQKHFRAEWFANIQDLTMFFRKYLTPEERADVIMETMEAMTSASKHNVWAASRVLRMILRSSLPDIGKVPEIVEYICHHMNRVTEAVAQETIRKVLPLLAQTHTDEVIQALFKIHDEAPRGSRKPWEILASFPKGCEVILGHLLKRLTPQQQSRGQEPGCRTEISPLIATRALRELLLEPGCRTEAQAFFPSLFTALLFQISSFMAEGAAEAAQDQHHVTQWVDPISSTVEALKTLMRSTGYSDHVSYVQKLGGWELLTKPERYHKGVALLARAMVTKNCWHVRPVFSLTLSILQEPGHGNHLTALVFITELLQSPDVAAIVDEVAVRTLASWFQCAEPAAVRLLLRAVEILARHEHTGKQLHALQPYVLSCCYSADGGIVAEAFHVLQGLVRQLTWQHAAAFLIQLAFTLGPFLEEESEHLRLMAFEIYGALLAKVTRRVLVFPLRHQVLNLLVLLVLHLEDANVSVAQVARPALCRTATLMGWLKLRAIFAEKDIWTILSTLLKQEEGKALWFLTQSVMLFKSPQARIRQAAVWFAECLCSKGRWGALTTYPDTPEGSGRRPCSGAQLGTAPETSRSESVLPARTAEPARHESWGSGPQTEATKHAAGDVSEQVCRKRRKRTQI
ncbi:maestro heat-like repeat-containing protein family member 7 isoform X3 [Hippopotamus amphibius kiboko]|uniref:maestro heat-like repeat-containing protein family member 7 isoform X3 n=1 Tax=Hippopotamus amphibius kiboko TaxID=575201 RepID=UPI0025913370|nr:maestro heat-like repeat-containing protein family member 7 isoform X3 [Hippopotamus amphibius kiboko]